MRLFDRINRIDRIEGLRPEKLKEKENCMPHGKPQRDTEFLFKPFSVISVVKINPSLPPSGVRSYPVNPVDPV